MKRMLVGCMVALVSLATFAQKGYPDLKPEQNEKLRAMIGNSLTVKAQKRRRLLVFYRCEGYAHKDSIVVGNEAFRIAAEQTGAFKVDFSRVYSALTPENLAKYDGVVLLNTTFLKTKENPGLVPSLINFVKSGKGLAVIHAGADNFYQADDAADMVGGRFWGHPWHAGGTWAFHVEEPNHPLVACFGGKDFKFSDEIYQQQSPAYDRKKLRVLISLDMKDPKTAGTKGQKRADKDFAVSWVRPYGAGRVFYTSFGHDQRAWLDAKVQRHIFDGVQYTLGDLKVEDQPR